MNRKLWAVNLLLLVLAVCAGWQLRLRWLAEKAREAAEMHRKLTPIPAPPYTAAPVPMAAAPGNYVQIAQKDLFDRSRNPDVPVEPPPPPPPKPPMPPLPVYHGSMDIGDGPMAILSLNANAPQEAIRPGEAIGPFKLIDITRQDITLDWNGELVRKSIDELSRTSAAATETPARTAAPAAAPAAPPTPKGPGDSTAYGSKLCVPSDTTPFGTVQDGYRKTEIKTPFGNTCLWDPVK